MMSNTQLSDDGKKAIDTLVGQRLKRRNRGALIRNSFVRSNAPDTNPPISMFASNRGGSEVALKLYIAVLWISVKSPYDTNIEAADWARILDLPDPDSKGAARIRQAFKRLVSLKLISKETVKNQRAKKITPLKEDGTGDTYRLPKINKEADQYFAVPNKYWINGSIQKMSSAALIMLLILLEEQRKSTGYQWWSQKTFNERFHISKDVRAKGTKELVRKKLLTTKFEKIRDKKDFLRPRKTRKTYKLIAPTDADGFD